MSITRRTKSRVRTRKAWLLGSTLALVGSIAPGCTPPPISEDATDMGTTSSCSDDEGSCLDPKVFFANEVKPELASSCGICHQIAQGTVPPFLTVGSEYTAVIGYNNGAFLTANPDESVLLKKGKHIGPALTETQYSKVQTWLSIEAATRGKGMGSPTTPTVPIRLGDFSMNLETLLAPVVSDPLASITFTLELLPGRVYRIKNLTLNAGPTSGIHIKHPRFIVFSSTGATPEANDAFSTVDLTVAANMKATIGGGSLQLTSVPITASRIAFAFEVIEPVNPNPGLVLKCKNYAMFEPAVRSQLSPCAALCHSSMGMDARAGQATGAFDMSPILTGDFEKLCVRTLGRIFPSDPPRSILVRQPAPYDPTKTSDPTNGTPNHSYYKITDATKFMNYKAAISTWATGEK